MTFTQKSLVYAMGYTLDDLFNDKPLNSPGSTRVRERYTLSAESLVVADVYEDADEYDKKLIDAMIKTIAENLKEKKNGTDT